MLSNGKHTHHNWFSFWNRFHLSIEYPSSFLLSLTLLIDLSITLVLILSLINRGFGCIRIVLPRIWTFSGKVSGFTTIVARKIVILGSSSAVCIICIILLLWCLICRANKDLLSALALLWAEWHTAMILRMVDHLLTLSTRRPGSKYFLLLRLLMSAVILLQSDSNVDCLMLSCVTTSCHHGLKFSVQASKKMILFLPVSIHILNSILRQVVETPNIMHHRVLPLLKSQELF